jgi:hypothetical protein
MANIPVPFCNKIRVLGRQRAQVVLAVLAPQVPMGFPTREFEFALSSRVALIVVLFSVSVITLAGSAMAVAANLVMTQHNDGSRSGAQHETLLNVNNVKAGTFGKIFTRNLMPSKISSVPHDRIYTQPLIAVTSKGQKVVIVATQSNRVYAFDAEKAANAQPVWMTDLGPPEVSKNGDWPDDHCNDSLPVIGVLGTPVIVPHTKLGGAGNVDEPVLYVVAKHGSETVKSHAVHFTIYKLNVSTGAVIAQSTLPQSPEIGFDPYLHLQRAGLVFVENAKATGGGYVYAAFGGHCDVNPFHGWVFGFDGNLTTQVAALRTSGTGTGAGIWQAGQAPVLARQRDLDFLYVATGNGYADAAFSNSVLKLIVNGNGSVGPVDVFTPYNNAALNTCDTDLASAGPTLMADKKHVVIGGKEGVLYSLDTTALGAGKALEPSPGNLICLANNGGGGFNGNYQWNVNGDNVFQEFKATTGHIHGSPVHTRLSDGRERLYLWSEDDQLKSFTQLPNGKFDTVPVQSKVPLTPGMPGGALSISTAGGIGGDTIVWATHPVGDAWSPKGLQPIAGTLFAFNGEDVTAQLWNSDVALNDKVGEYSKFSPPTISDGRVYVATFDGHVQVYGLKDNSHQMCLASCAVDRDFCISQVGKPGGPLAKECAQEYKACIAHCPK